MTPMRCDVLVSMIDLGNATAWWDTYITQTSIPSYPPFSNSVTLPWPPSSASNRKVSATDKSRIYGKHIPGVPSSTMVPGMSNSSRTVRTASATATPEIAMRLWPQACPIPGSASISLLTPSVRPPLPWVNLATHAVSSR